jgi:hypothetical protein
MFLKFFLDFTSGEVVELEEVVVGCWGSQAGPSGAVACVQRYN